MSKSDSQIALNETQCDPSATIEGSEMWRHGRIIKAVEKAKGIVAEKASKDLSMSIKRLEDFEGALVVTWWRMPTQGEIQAFDEAWEDTSPQHVEHVVHVFEGKRIDIKSNG